MKKIIGKWPSSLQMLKSHLSYQWRRSALPDFLHWWRKELIACLPTKWQNQVGASTKETLLCWHSGSFEDVSGIETNLIDLKQQRRRILILPHEDVLLEPIELPSAACTDAKAVLAFEMDKYTPFTSNQVYFDVAWDKKNTGTSGSMNLWMAVVLRKRLDKILDQALEEGIRIDAVDALDDHGKRININLMPLLHRPKNRNPARQIYIILACFGFVLLVSVMQLWVSNRQRTLEEMNAQVIALRTATEQTRALQQQLDATLISGRFIQDRKLENVSKVSLLSELTSCVPTDTWLEQLEIGQTGEMNLTGQSSHTNELIEKMKSCPSLEDLQFQGIIQPDRSTGLDRFSLTARVRIKDDNHAPLPISP